MLPCFFCICFYLDVFFIMIYPTKNVFFFNNYYVQNKLYNYKNVYHYVECFSECLLRNIKKLKKEANKSTEYLLQG